MKRISKSTSGSTSISRVAIVIKRERQKILDEAERLIDWLNARSVTCFTEKDTADKLSCAEIPFVNGKLTDIDLIICLGGDGTLLSTVKHVAGNNVPILGVNMGSLGFLTETSLSDMYNALEKVLAGNYKVSERTTFNASIEHNEKSNSYTVLNDVVVNKRALARIIELELTINDTMVSTYQSDGLIIATPTGSTAYSLSAGGPIIYPSVECIVISPICPHTLTHRPIIVPDSSVIKVKLISKDDVQITLDGQMSDSLEYQNEVVIKKSDGKIKLIESFEKNYYEILRTKLHWGKRGTK